MIDIIPGIQFSESEKQLYGAIAAALLGALIGTVTSYLIANRERKKQDDAHNIRLNREHLRASANGLQRAELALTDLLIKNAANAEYVDDIKKGLVKDDGERKLALMQIATPFIYAPPDEGLCHTILNDKIVTLWGNLITEVELQNKTISDFGDFYSRIFATIHTALLKHEEIDRSVVESDSSTVNKAMIGQVRINETLRNKALDLVAQIDCFIQHLSLTNTKKFKTLKQYRDYIGELAVFEPEESVLKSAREDAAKTYDPKIMFKSSSTSDE